LPFCHSLFLQSSATQCVHAPVSPMAPNDYYWVMMWLDYAHWTKASNPKLDSHLWD
jgi:hypothetical protein